MIKKRKLLFSIIGLCLFLTACGTSANHSNKLTTQATVHNTKKQANTASQSKKTDTNKSQKSNDQNATTKKSQGMNLDQIKSGNFTSIAGNWKETQSNSSMYAGSKTKPGGDDQLTIANNKLTSNSITLTHDNLAVNKSNSGEPNNPVSFNNKDNYLIAELKNQNVAINWVVKFYPKNTTTDFSENNQLNQHDLIVIWTSSDNYSEVFENSSENDSSNSDNNNSTSSSKSQSGSMNLSQISNDDFSSLVGTWKNNDNKTIKITGNTVNAPEDSNFYKKVGTEVVGLPEIDGQPAVITSGKIANNYIQGSIGHFVSTGNSMDPLTIIPKGVKVSSNDDSDSNQDRLIEGGGQSGYANSAYYRQGN